MTVHLVIGASGMVGNHLVSALQKRGMAVKGTYFRYHSNDLSALDISDPQGVMQFIEQLQPAVIYLPAAMTNVDYCETHPEHSYQINVTGTRNVLSAAQQNHAQVVYFSTEYLFDGTSGPYREHDQPNPISVYGQHKWLAEQAVMDASASSLIVRTTVVYGLEPQGKNFIYRLVNTLGKGQTLRVPADQVSSPTYAPDLASSVLDLVQQGANGIYHIAGPDCLSRADFARTAAQIFDLDSTLIQSIQTSELAQAASRPLRAGLVVSKAEQQLGRTFVDYCQGLTQLKSEWEV